MAHEGHAFELSVEVATPVERAAVERAHDAVVVNQADHRDRVNRALRQELQNFGCVAALQSFHKN